MAATSTCCIPPPRVTCSMSITWTRCGIPPRMTSFPMPAGKTLSGQGISPAELHWRVMLGKVTTSYRYCIQLVHFVKNIQIRIYTGMSKFCSCGIKMRNTLFLILVKFLPVSFFDACTYTIYACWLSFSLYRCVNNLMFLPTSCARVSMSQRTYACIVSQASDTINFKQLVH